MAPKKRAPRLSKEELDNRRRRFARILFLKRLDAACPAVRKDLLKIWKKLEPRIRVAISALEDKVDAAFDPATEEIEAEYGSQVRRAVSISGLQMNVWSWYRTAPQDPDSLRSELEDDIREWARKNRIEADWIIDTAIENICQWSWGPAEEDQQGWFPPSVGMLGILTADDLEFRFGHQFWRGSPTRTRKDMRNEVWREFNKTFDEWYRKLSEKLEQRGYKKNLRWDHPERDIHWLVRFQYKREEYAAIAEGQKEVTADAVRHAVNKTAKFLDIDPRKARLGRRPKKKLA
jgi:hypothetical protein